MILASAAPLTLSLSVVAAAIYACLALPAQALSVSITRWSVGLAWLLHGIVLGWGLLWGETPHFGFAPALSFTTWLVTAVYAAESQIFPQWHIRSTLCSINAGTVLLALFFPGTPIGSSTSVWLPIHLALGVTCYGLFGTAVVHGWFVSRAENRLRLAKDPHSGFPLLTMERFTYRFVLAGFALLTATLAVGFLFGEALYGHAWQWNHKTVFSVLSWIIFAVLLVGRTWFGWRGKRAVRMLYAGSVFLLFAYVGSRFVIEIVLGRSI